MVAAAGVTLVPAAAFAALVPYFDEPRVIQGWPAVFAIDVALAYFFARVIFGRHPVIPFVVLLAIGANALGIVALAVAGSGEPLRPSILVPLLAAALTTALVLRKARVRDFWPYILFAGGLAWTACYFGGLSPAFALVPIVPFLPHAKRDPGFLVDAANDATDALSRFELAVRHPAQVALLLFGIVNAGVPLKALYAGAWAFPLAIAVGKPLGLLAGVAAARALGLHLPAQVGWRDLVVLGFVSSVGFTFALFFATAAVSAGPTLSALKIGALASVAGGGLALAAAALLRTGRFSARRMEARVLLER
jgi:NhaA family Na+:H+ antiporter